MEQLTDNGNGNYTYVDDIDEAQKLFVEDLTSTLQVIAMDSTPLLTPNCVWDAEVGGSNLVTHDKVKVLRA